MMSLPTHAPGVWQVVALLGSGRRRVSVGLGLAPSPNRLWVGKGAGGDFVQAAIGIVAETMGDPGPDVLVLEADELGKMTL